MKGISLGALLFAAIVIIAFSSLLFLFAWNVFVYEVLGFKRPINIFEAMAGSVGLNLIAGTIGTLFGKYAKDNKE